MFNTDIERTFLKEQFAELPLIEETVGVGVDVPQAQPYPRMARPSTTSASPRTQRSRRRHRARGAVNADEDEAPARDFPSHLDRPGRRLPAPPSPVRANRAVRRPHRSRQGLRRADRILQPLREERRRCDARADGRQADGAAGRAVHPLCRAPVGTRAAAGARSRHRRRLPVALRKPVAPGARGRCRSAPRFSSTAAARSSSSTASAATAACTTPTATSSSSACTLLVGDERLRAAMGRNGRDYVRQNYRWDVVLGKYERVFAKIRNALAYPCPTLRLARRCRRDGSGRRPRVGGSDAVPSRPCVISTPPPAARRVCDAAGCRTA